MNHLRDSYEVSLHLFQQTQLLSFRHHPTNTNNIIAVEMPRELMLWTYSDYDLVLIYLLPVGAGLGDVAIPNNIFHIDLKYYKKIVYKPWQVT